MTAWCHLPTIFKQRRALQIAGLGMLCAAFITTLLFANVSHAATSTNRVINFQGRLLTSSGAVVPDGYYNIQFKIYQGGDGQEAGDTGGTLNWTESHINNGGTSGVEVRGGFFSVSLGSITPFGSSVDWDQSNLWLSMNIAGSSASCTAFGSGSCVGDGEMLPMKQVTATPYAIDAGAVGGKTASDLVQNGTTQQTADFNISGTGQAATLQGNTSVISPLFDSNSSATLSIGSVTASTINLGSATSDQIISIGSGSGNKNLTLGSTSGSSHTIVQGGSQGVEINGGTGEVALSTNGADRLVMNATGATSLTLGSGQNFTVRSSDTTSSLTITDSKQITTSADSTLNVQGSAAFSNSVTVQGAISTNTLDTANPSTLSIGSTNATTIAIGNTTTNGTTILYGNTVVKPSTGNDSTIAFQLQRADGTPTLTADSLNQTITIGNAVSGDKMMISTATGQVTYYGSARHTKKISLSAEYAGSVLDAGTASNNNGTMTSGLDLTGRMNYYKWTTDQSSNQSYDVVVQVPLPTDFDGWASSNPLSIDTYTSDIANGIITLEARDSTNTVRCNFVSLTPSATSTWSTNTSACTLNTGTYTAGGYMTLRIRMQSPNGGDVRVGNISLSYLSKY